MASSRKVYDFPMEKTSRTLVTALKKRRNESTVADLVSVTGLPKFQVEESLKHVLAEYDGHMKVTESGEILYYFPRGMRSTLKGFIPTMKKTVSRILSVTGRVLSFLFKIWIMVMLVGYFAIFIALLLLAILASVAGSMSNRDSDNRSRGRDGGGFFGFYLTTRVIELFIQIWLYSGMRRQDSRYGSRQQIKKRPLHKSIFNFVFGEGDPNAGWDVSERQTVIRFIQSHKGVITVEEFMALTGKRPREAEQLMNRYLLEFEGEPDVTEGGTLIYRFPELMRTREQAAAVSLESGPMKSLIPFNTNPGATNRWIGILNSVNILFGSYFLYYSLFVDQFLNTRVLDVFFVFVARFVAQFGDPRVILALGLGAVPFVFSILFYAVPAVRRFIEKKKNEEIRKENLRKKLYARIMQNPDGVNPEVIEPSGAADTPANLVRFREDTVKELGATKGVEVAEVRTGVYSYSFPEILRERQDVEAYRKKIDVSKYALGDTVFDSGE